MAQTTFVDGRGVVHVNSGGSSTVYPNTCMTPSDSTTIPYSSTGSASDTSNGPSTVTCDGCMPMVAGAKYSKTSGDEAGTYGGVTSGTYGDEAEFITYSFDVQFEGKGVCRVGDTLFHNDKNASG